MTDNDDDTLVRRRPRRSTAGNRMEAALAEFAALNSELELELEDDVDFVGPADEEEVFDSDFQSTDDEAAHDEEAAAEKEAEEEERQERRSTRQRTLRNVDPPNLRRVKQSTSQKASGKKPKKSRTSRRVSLGGAVDAETGETVSKRQSRRQSTMLATQNLNTRLRSEEERRALAPKRHREVAHEYTQAELIARALDTEGGNIIEHRDYLEQEEEKRRRARVVRKALNGPILKWVSRIEDEKVPVEPLRPPQASTSTAIPGPSHLASTNGSAPSTDAPGGFTTFQGYSTIPIISMPPLPPIPNVSPAQYLPAPVQPPPQAQTVRVNKNYLVHELDQQQGTPKPSWNDTMETIFGDHVDWPDVKVYSTKNRPLSRVVVKCPLTGRPAIYRDPRSGVPYANARAFKSLTHLLSQEYAWNEKLACYTVREGDVNAPDAV